MPDRRVAVAGPRRRVCGGPAQSRFPDDGVYRKSTDSAAMDCGRSAGEDDDRVPFRRADGYGARSPAVSVSVSVYRNGPLEPSQNRKEEPSLMSGRNLPFIGIPSCVRTLHERDFHTVNERYPNAVIDP